MQYGFPSDDDEAQRRMIMVSYPMDNGETVRVLNGYFPQGENQTHETKYPAKRKYYQDLMGYLNEYHTPEENVIVMGDVNVSHTDLDIGIGEPNRKRWLQTKKCSFLPEEREWLNTLIDWGFTDGPSFLHIVLPSFLHMVLPSFLHMVLPSFIWSFLPSYSPSYSPSFI